MADATKSSSNEMVKQVNKEEVVPRCNADTSTSTKVKNNPEDSAMLECKVVASSTDAAAMPLQSLSKTTAAGEKTAIPEVVNSIEEKANHHEKKPERNSLYDVHNVRGGAAQTISHPGNLFFYKVCEDRFPEWQKLPQGDYRRRTLAAEVVQVVLDKGGVFCSKNNKGKLSLDAAIDKTKSRMRQIERPKVRVAVGAGHDENDVVFAHGGRNHLYPGNAKWRALLDTYADQYFGDKAAVPTKERQLIVVEETIAKIHERGGKFRDKNLRVIAHAKVIEKTHARFKDIKREWESGKIVKNGERTLNRSGCTSILGVIDTHQKDLLVKQKKTRKPVPWNVGFTPWNKGLTGIKHRKREGNSWRRKRSSSGKGDGDEDDIMDDDEVSWDSAMLDSDDNGREEGSSEDDVSDNEEGSDEEDGQEYMAYNDAAEDEEKRQKQHLERKERLKRRQSGIVASSKPKETERKRRKRKDDHRPPSPNYDPPPNYELSEYEKLRLAKIKRNQGRLKDLGLA